MKKLLCLVLALSMALSLAACGGSSASSSAAASSAAAPAASSEAASAAAADGRLTEAFTDEAGIVHPAGLPTDFPSKDITYICPFAAGGTYDTYFRVLAEKIKELEGWDHSMVVEYKEGASGDVGWTALYESKPDGYTIGFCPTPILITVIGWDKPYGIDGFDYIDSMMLDPGVIGVSAKSPYNTLSDLVNAAVENPGSVSIGVTAVTASEGLTIKLLEKETGAQFNVIPFDGEAEILTAVSGGHCDAFCLNVSDGRTFVEEGAIKYLATGDTERSVYYPDLPTYQESGYDVVQYNCRAIACPEGTDPAVLEYLSNCFMAAAASDDVIAKADQMQVCAVSMGTEAVTALFEQMNESYQELWATSPWN